MTSQLNEVMVEEYKVLKELLETLDEQYEHLTKREVFALDKVVKKIEECSKNVARWEVERRKLTGNREVRKIIEELKDDQLEKNYKNIVKLLEEIQLQKDTNEMLIKQGLGFTTQMLNFINPDRGAKTYNAYGKRR